jgi:hypothetical protein
MLAPNDAVALLKQIWETVLPAIWCDSKVLKAKSAFGLTPDSLCSAVLTFSSAAKNSKRLQISTQFNAALGAV